MDILRGENNFICKPVTELPEYMYIQVTVPNEFLDFGIPAGLIVSAEELYNDNFISGNSQVYKSKVFDNSDNSEIPAIVLNGGFETLSDGRRPNGQPDYTKYLYSSKDIITAVRLLPETKFELSPDVLINPNDVYNAVYNKEDISNTYITYGEEGGFIWTESKSLLRSKVNFVVEGYKWFRLGDEFGSNYCLTLIVRTKYFDVPKFNTYEIKQMDTVELSLNQTPNEFLNSFLSGTYDDNEDFGIYDIDANPTLGFKGTKLGIFNLYNYQITPSQYLTFGYGIPNAINFDGSHSSLYVYMNNDINQKNNYTLGGYTDEGWYEIWISQDNDQEFKVHIEKVNSLPSIRFDRVYEIVSEDKTDVITEKSFLDLVIISSITNVQMPSAIINNNVISKGGSFNGEIAPGETVASLMIMTDENVEISFADGENQNNLFEIQDKNIVNSKNLPIHGQQTLQRVLLEINMKYNDIIEKNSIYIYTTYVVN